MPNWQPLVSSLVERVAYDAQTRELLVTLAPAPPRPRSTYVFARVPPRRYRGLLASPSPGIYFNANIHSRYPTRLLSVALLLALALCASAPAAHARPCGHGFIAANKACHK